MAKRDVEKFEVIQNAVPVKAVVIRNETGRIKQVMDRPKIDQVSAQIHTSGCHMFQDNPEQNHYDHYYNGKTWKERSTNDKTLVFPYEIKDKVLECKILPGRFVIIT